MGELYQLQANAQKKVPPHCLRQEDFPSGIQGFFSPWVNSPITSRAHQASSAVTGAMDYSSY